jgi:subtilisin family serine protease
MTNVKLRAQLRQLAMKYPARVLFLLAPWVCAGALALQAMTGAALAQQGPRQAVEPSRPRLAPIANDGLPNTIPGQYIVVLRPSVSDAMLGPFAEKIKALGVDVVQIYPAIRGLAVRAPTQDAKDKLRALPEIDYIEANQRAKYETSQNMPPVGLDRIDQREEQLNGKYNFTLTGKDIHVYVIDSGVFTKHKEFRVDPNDDATSRADSPYLTGGGDDCTGHGTHVAGIIGGKTFGVAKEVSLHSVRVNRLSDCLNPDTWALVDAVQWVTAQHMNPAVVNMSLTLFYGSDALDEAIERSISAGVTYVVAASTYLFSDALEQRPAPSPGATTTTANPTTTADSPPPIAHACRFSPGRLKNAITVGEINSDQNLIRDVDLQTSRGQCIDIFAPGGAILSAALDSADKPTVGCMDWDVGDTSPAKAQNHSQVCSGTSMASAHVAGCAALVLQALRTANPGVMPKPAEVWEKLQATATSSQTAGSWKGILDRRLDSPNLLLYCGL